jgi:hypothetical protein
MQIRYYTYSKNVLNKVVCHTTEAEPVTDWLYVHKEQPDQWGRVELKFYAYYPEIKTGIFLCSVGGDNETWAERVKENWKHISTAEGFIAYVDSMVANGNFVGGVYIALAMQINAHKGAEYAAYRESYIAKQNAQHEAQRKERIEKEQAANAKLVEEEKVMINNLLSTMQNGGEWRNENSPISGSSILNVIADQNDFTFPIKFKGWVNKHLRSLTFENGMCKYYSYAKGHKSTTVANYVFGLMEHLKTIATDEELQHLFGLDKK